MAKKKQLWFKAKSYGWGWVPASWQGWAALGLYLMFVFGSSVALVAAEPETYQPVILYVIGFVLATCVLLALSYHYGEKPEWRWGGKSGKAKK